MKKQELKNGIQDLEITEIKKSIKILNDHSGTLKTDMAIVKNDVAWLKRFFWVSVTAAMSAAVASILNLIK